MRNSLCLFARIAYSLFGGTRKGPRQGYEEMSDEAKPRRVKAKITRLVTEWAIVNLDRNGNLDEFVETVEEIEHVDVMELHSIDSVLSVHS